MSIFKDCALTSKGGKKHLWWLLLWPWEERLRLTSEPLSVIKTHGTLRCSPSRTESGDFTASITNWGHFLSIQKEAADHHLHLTPLPPVFPQAPSRPVLNLLSRRNLKLLPFKDESLGTVSPKGFSLRLDMLQMDGLLLALLGPQRLRGIRPAP